MCYKSCVPLILSAMNKSGFAIIVRTTMKKHNIYSVLQIVNGSKIIQAPTKIGAGLEISLCGAVRTTAAHKPFSQTPNVLCCILCNIQKSQKPVFLQI